MAAATSASSAFDGAETVVAEDTWDAASDDEILEEVEDVVVAPRLLPFR